MKKKTIKFYFSKTPLKSMFNTKIFCFSKRAFYHNRQIEKYEKKKVYIKKRESYENIQIWNEYKILIKDWIKTPQWNKNKKQFKRKFFRSVFSSPLFFRNSKKYKNKKTLRLKLWYFLKNKHNNFFRKFIHNYPKTGILTSHAARLLSRKNLTYQIWSKYRTKTFNMNFYNSWFYFCSKYVNIYVYTLLRTLYAFSANPSIKNLLEDEHFNVIKTFPIHIHLYNNTNYQQKFLNYDYLPTQGPISLNFNNSDLLILLTNAHEIENILINYEKKKEELQNELKLKITSKTDLLFLRFFVFNGRNIYTHVYILKLLSFLQFYNTIFGQNK